MIKILVEGQEGDEAYVESFLDKIDLLTGMVKEMVADDPKLLLSSIMRKLLIEKAADVDGCMRKLRISGRVWVDNPNKPLAEC